MTSRLFLYLAGMLALAAVYFCAAKLGLSLAFVAEQVTVVWPPTGIALAAILLFGYRVWPGIALGAFLANATAHEPPLVACGIAAGNTLEAILGAWLLHGVWTWRGSRPLRQSRWGIRNSLERVTDVLALMILAGGLSTTVSATIGVTSLCWGEVQPWSKFGSIWWVWWLGDAMGALVIAPVLLTCTAWPRGDWRPRRVAEAVALLAGLGALSAIVFVGGQPRPTAGYPLEYTIFPFVIWAALRFGQSGAALCTLVALVIAIFGTVNGSGPFAGGPLHESLILLHLFLAVLAVTALLLGAAIAERTQAERRRSAGYAVTAALAESPTVEAAAPRLLQAVCESLDWEVGGLWTVDRTAGVLQCVAVWHRPSTHVPEFEAMSRGYRFAPDVGLPGRVWASGRPAWIEDVTEDANFPRAAVAAREGLHAAFGFPILLHGEILGVIEFFSQQIQPPDEDLLELMTAVGNQIGLFIERKQAEESLRRSETRYRKLVQQSPLAIEILAGDGRITQVNRSWEELWGVTLEQIPEYNLLRDRQVVAIGVMPQVQRAFAGETVAIPPVLYVPARGRYRGRERWVRAFLYAVKDEGGPASTLTEEVVILQEDVTEQRHAEQASRFLADAGAALAALVDPASTLQKVARLAVPSFADWCVVDMAQPDGSLRRMAVAHVDPSKIEYARELDRKYPPAPDAPHGALRVLRTGEPEMMTEIPDSLLVSSARDAEHLRILRELGLKSYLCVPLRVRGKTVGVISFVAAESGRRYEAVDLAVAEELARRASIALENAHLYAEVREADRRKDEFLAMLAHELRNPLAPIRNALHILKMPGVDRAILERARDMMERQVQHLVRLVDDLLDVSRIMRGRIELRKEVLDLAVAVGRAVETTQPAIEAARHELTVSLPAEPLLLEADLVRLAQVIGNLLNNAAKYTEPGGRISLTVRREDGTAVVRVRDSGVGIALETLPHIFDLFVQAERSLDRAQGGMGIGLTLVKTLVEMHGGSVAAFSEGPGKGSEFVVRLPLVNGDDARREEESVPSSASFLPPRTRRILVVDDNVDAAESLAVLLRLEGHHVRVAHDGPAALEAVQADPPHTVLLDLGMPGMDGYEVARRLRQQPGLSKVQLVALTGWGQEEDRRRTQEAGFQHHLTKPADPLTLRQLLAKSPSSR